MRSPESIIKRPLLTEKGTRLKDTGGNPEGVDLDPEKVKSQLLFEVARDANKVEIRRAVEKLWNVNVVSVHTAIVRGKEKRLGRYIGKRSNWKKAVVTIAPGQNIEFFEGV
jgi:large subunit ribosomal protein L23